MPLIRFLPLFPSYLTLYKVLSLLLISIGAFLESVKVLFVSKKGRCLVLAYDTL